METKKTQISELSHLLERKESLNSNLVRLRESSHLCQGV
jgi:hypothetical protein